MSSEVLEMYETLTDEHRQEVNNFIQRLVAQQTRFEQGAKDDWEEIFATADRMNIHSTENWKREDLYRV